MLTYQPRKSVKILAVLRLIILVKKSAILQACALDNYLGRIGQRPYELCAEILLSCTSNSVVKIVSAPADHVLEDLIRDKLVIYALRHDAVRFKPIWANQLSHRDPLAATVASIAPR